MVWIRLIILKVKNQRTKLNFEWSSLCYRYCTKGMSRDNLQKVEHCNFTTNKEIYHLRLTISLERSVPFRNVCASLPCVQLCSSSCTTATCNAVAMTAVVLSAHRTGYLCLLERQNSVLHHIWGWRFSDQLYSSITRYVERQTGGKICCKVTTWSDAR